MADERVPTGVRRSLNGAPTTVLRGRRLVLARVAWLREPEVQR